MQVEALDNEFVIDIACGYSWTAAFTSSGLVYFCGRELWKTNELETKQMPTIYRNVEGNNITSISGSSEIFAFVTELGELYTYYYPCDGGPSSPQRVDALSKVICKQVSCSKFHVAVLTEDGRVYTLGKSSNGTLLGHGGKKNTRLPALVKALETIDIQQIQCGGTSTLMALSRSGCVYICGDLHPLFTEVLLPRIILVYPLRDRYAMTRNVIEISCTGTQCAVLVDPSPSPVLQAQKTHFNRKERSDVTFIVENQPLYGQIEVLTKKSEYFEAMFVRSNTRESIERVVEIPDTSTAAFFKLLEYLCLDDFVGFYNFRFMDDLDKSTKGELIVLADMYLLDGLKLLCENDATTRGAATRITERLIQRYDSTTSTESIA